RERGRTVPARSCSELNRCTMTAPSQSPIRIPVESPQSILRLACVDHVPRSLASKCIIASERRVCGATEDPPENARTPRSALVGAGSKQPRSLLSLSAPLPHPSRAIGILLHTHQSGRKTL